MSRYIINRSESKGILHVSNIGSNSIEKAEKMLKGIEGGIDKAMRSAISRAAAKANTNSSRCASEIYDISAREISSNQNVTLSYNYRNGSIQALLKFSGRKIPLINFNATTPKVPTREPAVKVPVHTTHGWRLANPSVPVKSHLMRDSVVTDFLNAFTIRTASGHSGIFVRDTNTSDNIRELTGLSTPQMLNNETVIKNLTNIVHKTFEERLDHEVERLLNGYGG